MQKRSSLCAVLLACMALCSVCAEEPEHAKPALVEPGAETAAAIPSHAFFVTGGSMLLVNTDSNSAPSPIMFSLGAGTSLWQTAPVTLQPRISFFTNYYAWDGENARPAEVENRTALVLSALVDLCAVKTWWHGASQFQAGAGAGIWARLSVLANGVSSEDSGVTDSDGAVLTTAGDDVRDIQNWFWRDLRWLYPELCFSWLHRLPQRPIYAGVDMRFYVPLTSLKNGNAMDAALASMAFKLQF